MAKQRYKPKESLLLAWEERAEAVSGDFHSQEVANTLRGNSWVHVTPTVTGCVSVDVARYRREVQWVQWLKRGGAARNIRAKRDDCAYEGGS
jgi:hypothetical protein